MSQVWRVLALLAVCWSVPAFADDPPAPDDFVNGMAYFVNDPETAAEYFRSAAASGYAPGAAVLGEMYQQGRGVSKDAEQAAYWHRRAAEAGIVSAQFNLGIAYLNGSGVPKDIEQAALWFSKASEQGDSTAQYLLGVMYRDGEGVRPDLAYSTRLFRASAKQGRTEAQLALSQAYYRGDGVDRDLELAYLWLKVAQPSVGKDNAASVANGAAILEKMLAPDVALTVATRAGNCRAEGSRIRCD